MKTYSSVAGWLSCSGKSRRSAVMVCVQDVSGTCVVLSSASALPYTGRWDKETAAPCHIRISDGPEGFLRRSKLSRSLGTGKNLFPNPCSTGPPQEMIRVNCV